MAKQADAHAIRLGAVIRALRESKDVSQTELAARTKFHRNWIGRVERGQVHLTVFCLARIADALDMRASDLLRKAGQ